MSGKKTKIKDLIPDDQNFNTGTEFGGGLIEKSLSKFGAGRSILLDKNNRIIAGNKTVENAAAIGLDDVQIVETDGKTIIAVKRTDIDLDTKRGREMALADNATAKANISWDAAAITEWEMPYQEWGIDLATEIEPAGEADAEPQIDKAAELNEKWKVKAGDLWRIGDHRLLCGDSTKKEDVGRLMQGQKAEFGFADPPYNLNIDYGNETDDAKSQQDYEDFSAAWFALFKEFVTGTKIVTPGIANIGLWHLVNKPDWVAAWVKMNGQSRNKFGGTNKWEPVLCWDVPYDQGIDVFQVNNEYGEKLSNGYHPVSKPTELLKTIIGRFEGKTVYEPFGGCGTTVIACQNLGKPSFNIEVNPDFCAVILERMATAFPGIEIKRIEAAEAAKT